MPHLLPGGDVQGCGAVPGCEVSAGREAGDVADCDEQTGGGAGRADAVEGVRLLPGEASSSLSSLLAAFLRSARGHRSTRRRPDDVPCLPHHDDARSRAASSPGQRTSPSSHRRESVPATGHAAARSCAYGPRRARGAGRPESVAACVARHQRSDATHWSGCRPARPSGGWCFRSTLSGPKRRPHVMGLSTSRMTNSRK